MDCIKIANDVLNKDQKEIIKECITMKSGGLSLEMGYGKTILGLTLGLEYYKETGKPALIIVPKTLISNWIYEINKFFGDKLKYVIFHNDNIKKIEEYVLPPGIGLIITTPQVTSKYYKKRNIQSDLIKYKTLNRGMFNQRTVIEYLIPSMPMLTIKTGGELLYSTQWGCIIVDEVHKYTNITSNLCKSIIALSATHRWVMSGTIFDEPKVERILGYYLLIHNKKFPNSVSEAETFIKYGKYKGYTNTMVMRETNKNFVKPIINEVIINHVLSREEALLYISMKEIMGVIADQMKYYRSIGDNDNFRKFSSYLLAMITYLRQSVVSPILPIANAIVDTCDITNTSQLSRFIVDKINELDIENWLNDANSVKSTRITEALKVINNYKHEKVIIFTNFRTIIDLFKSYLPQNRNVLILTSTLSTETRGELIETFNNSTNDILLLTYAIGAEGLNLQSCKTMLLLDLYWNIGKINQAIARIFRPGQLSKEIDVYYFMANTGMEKALLQKNKEKMKMLNEVKSGNMKSKLKNITVNEVIKIIEIEDNINDLMSNINLNKPKRKKKEDDQNITDLVQRFSSKCSI